MSNLRIGLIDVDGHNFPNLALMKISAHHKAHGDAVDWCNRLEHYDIAYKSRVFDYTYSTDDATVIQADRVICGGTGYGLDNKLPDEIEHIYGEADNERTTDVLGWHTAVENHKTD